MLAIRSIFCLFLITLLGLTDSQALSFGSGFFVSKDGYIITCAHCVPENCPIEVLAGDGIGYPAAIVFADREHDIACIKIDGESSSCLALGDSTSIGILDDVFVFGFPLPSSLGSDISASSGKVNAVRGALIQIDAAINPGNSGGPVINGEGVVIGMAVAKLKAAEGVDPERVNFAVASKHIISELKSQGVDITLEGQPVDSVTKLEDLAIGSTVQIVAASSSDVAMPDQARSSGEESHELIKFAAAQYVLLGNAETVEEEIAPFAETVDYYDSGVIGIQAVREDTERLRKRWPERFYVITGVDDVSVDSSMRFASAVVSSRFALFNEDRFFKGEAATFVLFEFTSGVPRVVLVREHRRSK